MNSDKGLVLAVVVTTLTILAVTYFAWQTHNILRSLERIAVQQEKTTKEVKNLLTRADTQPRRGRQDVRLPNVKQWLKSLEKPLAAKAMELMGKAQRSKFEASLKRWSARIQEQDKKQWQNLYKVLGKDREDVQRKYQQGEKRWQELVEALGQERKGAREQYASQEKRWVELMDTIRLQGEKVGKQYREVVQKLNEEKAEALARTKQLEEERNREIGKLLDQAKKISRDRQRQLGEFCAKRPESVICRDL